MRYRAHRGTNGTAAISRALDRSHVTMIARRSRRSATTPPTGAANLPSELAGELGIEIVPMYLKFGAEVYRDGFDLTPADFYQRLARNQEPASTSMPSPGDYLEAFERAGQEQIVCVTIASTMS